MRSDELAVSAVIATGVATDADIRTFEQEAGMASPTASRKDVELTTPSARLTPAHNFDPPSGFESEDDPEERNCLTNTPLRYFFSSRWWFLFFICSFCCLQSLQVTGLFSSTISSIQARYHVDSTTAGGFWAVYDSVVAISVLGFALAGGRSHIPRFLGLAAVLVGVGSLFYSSPQYFSGKYEFKNDRTPFCSTSSFTQTCHEGTSNIIPLFFIGQAITATGAACLYTLGPAYLDRIFSRKDYPIALGCFYFVSAVGPAIGFLIASRFLNMWVDLGTPPDPNLQPSDREWVGAWWLAYLVAGLLVIVFSVPLFMFPKYVIGTKPTRDENKRHAHAIERQLMKLQAEKFGGNSDEMRSRASSEYMERHKTWQQTFRSVLTNKTFMFNVLAQAANSFTIAGVSSFLPKVAQSLFGLTAGDASFSIGLVVIPGAAGGSLIGGYFLKRIKAKPLTAAKMLIIVEAIAIVFCTFLLFGCNTPQIVGIQKPYPDSTGSYLNATCNLGCVCNEDKYNPICGSNGQTYFSACHAGCTGMSANGKNFWNCSCVTDGLKTAVKNVCAPDCNAQTPFLILLFLAMFFTFLSTVPAITVIIRSLPFQDRPAGLAFQNVVSRSLGAVPGPPITGLALDSACFLFSTSCGSKLADCVEYDNYDIRSVLAIVILIPKALTVIFYSISYYFFRDVYPDGEDLIEEPASDHAAILSQSSLSSSSLKDGQL